MTFVDPHTTLLQLGLRDGMKVGDFGAGSGHYALAASSMIGEEGRVYAVDVQEDVLKRLKTDALQQDRFNIDYVWADFEKPTSTKLKDGILDAAILSNALFQLEDRQGAVKEIARVLKSGGKLLVIDWTGAHGGMGPRENQVVNASDAEGLVQSAGFTKVKSFDPGPHHYALVFSKV